MVRFLISVLLAAAAASAFCARASATTEFCPAVLDIAPTGKAPAQTYGIQLRALSERRVTVRLAFDTSAGWYQTDVSEAELSPSIRTIPLKYPVDVPISASPVMYVRFPAAVTVNHAFIIRALSIGDVFHWSDRGQVTCPIAPEAWQDPQYSLADLRDLSAPPPHDATFLAATARSPLEAVSCPEPYAPAKTLHAADAVYPDAARAVGATGTSVVGVALNPNGSVADTWVQGSSNDTTLDAAAQSAAQSSTYQAARAYCQDVPSIYYFVVTFGQGSGGSAE